MFIYDVYHICLHLLNNSKGFVLQFLPKERRFGRTRSLMASSGTFSSSTVNNGSQLYPYPSHVNAASFVSIELTGRTNYSQWREQMMSLVRSHGMLGFIDGTLTCPEANGYMEWKRSDTLVKGWIFGSLTGSLLATVESLQTAHDVWKTLDIINNPWYKDSRAKYLPLYRAIMTNDWDKAQDILSKDVYASTVKLNSHGESAIHIAISTSKNIQFVTNLLTKIHPESIPDMLDNLRWTALHRAAIVGNTQIAKVLVEKCPQLLFIDDCRDYLPIHRACSVFQNKDTFLYLLDASKQHIGLSRQHGYQSPFEGTKGALLISNVISIGLLDVAYGLIKQFPNMATTHDGIHIPFRATASLPDLYFSGTPYNFYQRFVYKNIPIKNKDLFNGHINIEDIERQPTNAIKYRRSCFYPVIQSIYAKFWKVALLYVPHIKHLHKDKVKHHETLMLLECICEEVDKIDTYADIFEQYAGALSRAADNDTPEPIEVIIRYFPEAISTLIFGFYFPQFAIKYRCAKIYNIFVHQVSEKQLTTEFYEKDGNNLLHLAGQLAPTHKLNLVSGAALQMQRELQWFQNVEKLVLPTEKERTNKEGETPIMVFRREHKQLRKDGEEWMKTTANSYTITAALIITIAFAAAITVPGGNNGDTGKAIYAREPSFIIFAVSDAISLFTSTTSLLLFLSILTARYREEDFLYRLPKRLILGLATLFVSVTSMMVAFSATLFLLFEDQGKTWILIPIVALTCLPIASFVTLQFPLLVELISSTYGHGIFAKYSDHRIK